MGLKKNNKKSYFCINIDLLQTYVKTKILHKIITPDIIKQISCICISRNNLIKILGYGSLTFALKISAHKFSHSSIESIKNAGGEIIHIL